MVVNSKELLKKAKQEKYAIPQFNLNNLEWTKYILEECEIQRSPVILGVSEGAIKHMGGYKTVYNIITGLIDDLNITIPVVIHLDHGSTVQSCKQAIDSGFTSVMMDGSTASIEENIRMTKEVVTYANQRDVSVEAEVGLVGGEEDGIVNALDYAKTEDCVRLVNETQIDSLAASLGSIHGLYNGKANLNFERMKEISQQTNIPLVLHGGTGIADDKITIAIECGITKININTELQVAWAKSVRSYLDTDHIVYDPRKIIKSGEQSLKATVRNKIVLFKSNNRHQ